MLGIKLVSLLQFLLMVVVNQPERIYIYPQKTRKSGQTFIHKAIHYICHGGKTSSIFFLIYHSIFKVPFVKGMNKVT